VADVKEVLYSVIDSVGREKIRSEVSSETEAASRRYSAEIIRRCTEALGPAASEEELGTLCEALLHFMLTASLTPSERKVMVDGIELDIVVPSTKGLAKNPDKSLVIQVIKADSDRAKVAQAEKVQPNHENVWTVSAKNMQLGSRNYSLSNDDFKYPSIIADIRAFLADKGVNSLKLVH
jgi:hypothetical protein